MYRQDIAGFLFGIGGRVKNKDYFQFVEESYFTGIPSSDKPNLYLLIKRKSGDVLRIMANIEHTKSAGKNPEGQIWLSGQICKNENEKYGEHTQMHGYYDVSDIDKVVSEIE